MTSTTTTTTTTTNSTPSAEELRSFPATEDTAAAKAAKKRFEGLVTVRTKAVKGKGAWYWAHLEPILVRNPITDLPKAVKLRCSLCDAVFSASNPSRTATEHLKRGTCPNIASVSVTVSSPVPLSSLPPPTPTPPVVVPVSIPMPENHHRKRISDAALGILPALSGGRDDLMSLAMLESSVKRLKSPGSPSSLTKEQVDSAVELLAEWFYESVGSVSFSALESPKFRAFLARVGIPPIPMAEFSGARLDAKFGEAKAESDARIDDAVFFQVASGGWESLVRFTVNLPNRSSVFRKSVVTGGPVSSKQAEEIVWTAVEEICGGGGAERCVGIVSDKYKNKAMRNLEARNPWMVNLGCQLKGISSLIKDFNRDFPLFRIVAENCSKIAEFVNSDGRLRRAFQRYRARELLRSPLPGKCDAASLEDFLGSSRALQMAAMDESLKLVFSESQTGRDVAAMIQSESFWNELDSVYTLAKIVRTAARDIEADRPLIGQSLPLWEDLRRKVSKDWSSKSSPADSATVEKIIERRFKKNYHPAMAAAFILDPLNLTRDSAGKYLPPFKFLTAEQEKDVDRLVTRLVGREEAHIALMELMKWRSEGLDPLYAQAVQVKQRDPITGKMKIANPQSSRLVWETCLSELKTLGRVAIRLVFLQATSFGFKCNWSFTNWICLHRHSRVGLERAQKMLFVAAHAKLDRKDFSSEDERDAELLAGADHDDILNDVFSDAHSV